jgi:hypothetical protein
MSLACAAPLGCGSDHEQRATTSTAAAPPPEASASSSAAPAPPCREAMLEIRDAGFAGVAAGTLAEAIEFRSNRRCYLAGEPSVWLLSGAGHRIAVVEAEPSDAGRSVVRKGQPLYTDLFYTNPSIPVPPCHLHAEAMGIVPPGGRRRLTVKLKDPPLRFCPRGVRVSGFGTNGPIDD